MTMQGFMQLAQPRYLVPKTPVSVRVSFMPAEEKKRRRVFNQNAANQKKRDIANGKAINLWFKLPKKFTRQDVKDNGISDKSATHYIRRLIALEYVEQMTFDRVGAVFRKIER